jgi:hypothetical protein
MRRFFWFWRGFRNQNERHTVFEVWDPFNTFFPGGE